MAHPFFDNPRFTSKFTRGAPDECWLWRACKSHGYGQIRYEGKYVYAHRIACEHGNGPAPFPNAYAIHSCDTPACVNHRHIRWGTPADNMTDKVRRNRQSMGESHRLRKLTDSAVREIRARRAAGESGVALASEYGVTRASVSRVALRRGWRHVT